MRILCQPLSALVLATFGALLLSTPSAAQSKEGSVTGQVIDTSCFLGHDLHGDGHRQCAEICGRDKGVALAIVDDAGQVWYLADSNMPGTSQNEKLLSYAEQTVKATGTLVTKGPNRAIIIKNVALVKGTENKDVMKAAGEHMQM